MNWLVTIAVLLAPLLATLPVVLALSRTRWRDLGSAELGAVLLGGMLVATLLLRALDLLAIPLGALSLLGAASVAAASALVAALRLAAPESPRPDGARRPATAPAHALALLVVALLSVHLLLPAMEAVLRPVFGWDVTMHWATKARVWFDRGAMAPFVSNGAWLAAPAGAAIFTDHHPAYPPTIPLLQVWVSLAAGHWSESLVGLPWALFGFALALLFYGQARALNVPVLPALVFCYLVLSLPLVNTHVAIAGYADLPMGITLLAALTYLARWRVERARGLLILGLFFTLMLTQLKNEGFFWALALLGGLLLSHVPPRLAARTLLLATATGVALLFLVPDNLVIAGHSLARLDVRYRPGALAALVRQFTDYASWHLLPLLLPLWLLAFLRALRGDSVLSLPAFALAAAVSLYLFLFTMTRFSYGAFNVTAASRLLLHLAPALVFLAMLAWQRLPAPAARAVAPASPP